MQKGIMYLDRQRPSSTSLLYSLSLVEAAGNAIDCCRSSAAGGRSIRNHNLTSSGSRRRRFCPRLLSKFSVSTSPCSRSNCYRDFKVRHAYKDSGNDEEAYNVPPDLDNCESDNCSYGYMDDDVAGTIEIQIEETGINRRRIRSRVSVEASLQTVWNILTDYERLADFIPGLTVSQLLEKRDNFARLFQIGQQNLAFGLKFKAKGVIDCYERDIENFPFGQRRDIEFKMIEGDFQLFKGKWSVEQRNTGKYDQTDINVGEEFCTTIFYVVDVEPKVWLPVRLVQGRLCREIKMNLLCIQKAAERAFYNTGAAH